MGWFLRANPSSALRAPASLDASTSAAGAALHSLVGSCRTAGRGRMAARPRVPIEPGYFTIPEAPAERPRLLGSRCRACGEHFFPRRVVCARCLAQECEEVLLGPR